MIKRIFSKLRSLEQAVHDTRSSIELSTLGVKFRPWPASAIAPSALKLVINDVLINRRSTVIEFGAGISTIYLAKVLQKTGGRLVSFESDADWGALVKMWLHEEALSDQVELVVAPLSPCPKSFAGLDWYDSDVVQSSLADLSIDCVLVDGPVAYRKGLEMARYPAIPMIRDRLADRFAIFLDDTNRDGERAIIDEWERDLDLEFIHFLSKGGISMAVRGAAFDPQV